MWSYFCARFSHFTLSLSPNASIFRDSNLPKNTDIYAQTRDTPTHYLSTLKKTNKKRCWLFFKKKKYSQTKNTEKKQKFGRAEREAKFCLFFPTFFLLPIVFSLLFSLFLDVAFFFI
jgi:hypothetical protein